MGRLQMQLDLLRLRTQPTAAIRCRPAARLSWLSDHTLSYRKPIIVFLLFLRKGCITSLLRYSTDACLLFSDAGGRASWLRLFCSQLFACQYYSLVASWLLSMCCFRWSAPNLVG